MYSYLYRQTAESLALWLLRAALRVTRRRAVCAGCGLDVVPAAAVAFITDGCPVCGTDKLKAVRC